MKIYLYSAIMLAFCMFCVEVRTYFDSDLKLQYDDVPNQFHLMDQVSQSLPQFFIINDYKESWIAQFELSDEDKNYLEKYRNIRKKYQNTDFFDQHAPDKKSGLFAANPIDIPDVIADVFYTSNTINEALSKISSYVDSEERLFIQDFFHYFALKIDKMLISDNDSLQQLLHYFNKELEQNIVKKTIAEIARFYQSDDRNFQSMNLLLMPSNCFSFNGRCYGDHLQMIIPFNRINLDDTSALQFLVGVIVHEAAHHISATAHDHQKLMLTHHFLKTVGNNIRYDHFLNVLEEPLAIACQMLFMKRAYPRSYKKNSSWFDNQLAHKFANLIESYLEAHKSIDKAFIEQCAKIYRLHK